MLPTVGVFKLPLVITLLLLRREMNTYTPIEMPGLLARAQQGGERGQETSWVTGLGSETCLPCTQGCTKADFPCGYPSWAPESRWVKRIPQTDRAQYREATPNLWATTQSRDRDTGMGETQDLSDSMVAKRGGNRALTSAFLPQEAWVASG